MDKEKNKYGLSKSNVYLLQMKFLCPYKILMLKLNPNVILFGGETFGRPLGHEVLIHVFIRGQRACLLSFHHVRAQ
jgi:hypothetical protein